jgi:hypothetical protein
MYTYLDPASITYMHQDKDVHGVIVINQCAWNKAISNWVKDTINLKHNQNVQALFCQCRNQVESPLYSCVLLLTKQSTVSGTLLRHSLY